MDNISCIRQQADIKQINRCKDRVSELNGSFDYLSNGLELAGNNVRTENPVLTLRRETTLRLRLERHSRNDHFGNFTTPAKTQRPKTH